LGTRGWQFNVPTFVWPPQVQPSKQGSQQAGSSLKDHRDNSATHFCMANAHHLAKPAGSTSARKCSSSDHGANSCQNPNRMAADESATCSTSHSPRPSHRDVQNINTIFSRWKNPPSPPNTDLRCNRLAMCPPGLTEPIPLDERNMGFVSRRLPRPRIL